MRPPLAGRMARELHLSEEYLTLLAKTASFRYKEYTIPKHGGGTRLIHHPSRELKLAQRWLVKNVLSLLPVHDNVFSYREGVNIRDLAMHLAPHPYLCRIDFLNFFPSIKSEDVMRLLSGNPAPLAGWHLKEDDFEFITRIACRHKTLTIGAPSSPAISNAILFNLDRRISDAVLSLGARYGRYADDLYISAQSKEDLTTLHKATGRLIHAERSPQLRVNRRKTAFSSRASRRVVVGLNVTPDGKISIGRHNKRKIKAFVHRYLLNDLSEKDKSYLRGYISFVASVEPAFARSLARKYGKRSLLKIMREG